MALPGIPAATNILQGIFLSVLVPFGLSTSQRMAGWNFIPTLNRKKKRTSNICQHKALWFTKPFPHIASRLLLALGKQAWQLLLLSCTDEDTEPTIPQDSDPLMDRDKVRNEDRWWPCCGHGAGRL